MQKEWDLPWVVLTCRIGSGYNAAWPWYLESGIGYGHLHDLERIILVLVKEQLLSLAA